MMQIRYFLLYFLLSFISLSAYAQDINLDQFEQLSIRNIGPAGMSGRVTAIAVSPIREDHIFIGTASGGVWESTNGGTTWQPIFDKVGVQAIGALKINPQNPNDIWVGTGEGNPRNSHNSGKGIYRSIDGGKNWTFLGLENTRQIHRIIIHPIEPETVLVGALGAAWGPSTDRGVYKTTDGGETWKKVLYINEQTGIADLVADPQNPNKLIAASWEFGRKPWKFNSGGKGSGIHISYDSGDNWEKITDEEKETGLPKGDLGRIGLAIAPSKPNIVYALVEAKVNALYKSTDGGHHWQKVSDKNIGNRPFYYSEIYVDPHNENRIWNLWTYVSMSEDGGKTFKTMMDYGNDLHPDHHAFWLSPTDPNYIINGNDGGLNISRDGGYNWRFIENLPIGQFYHINYDMSIPYRIGGGMQDNGSWIGPSSTWKRGGIRNSDWREISFGDGFDMTFQPNNDNHGYTMSQGGYLQYYDYKTGNNRFIQPRHPDGVKLRFSWNAALAQDPFMDCGAYFGSQFVHKTNDCGDSWEIISPDLTTNDTIKQKESTNTGGLTLDVTAAENHTTITCIAPSPVDKNIIWAGTDDGNLQITRDGGENWTNLSNQLVGLPKGSWFAQIEVSTKNAGEAFVIVNNYRRNDFTPYAYHTTNYGQTWKRIIDDKKVSGYALCIVQDPIESNLLFLGTDHGLYFSLNGGDSWQKWDKNYPSVPTRDMKIHPREHDLIIGTFGRAIWVMDDIRPLRAIAASKLKALEQPIKLFDAPDAYFCNYRSVDGTRFIGQAEFKGKNKSPNARFSLWVKPIKKKAATETKKKKTEKEKEKKEKNEDKAHIVIYNANRDTIRNFSIKVKEGLNRFGWDLKENGIRFPSYQDIEKDANPPSGLEVLPGQYETVITYGDHRDSTMITVHPNPHSKASLTDLKNRYQIVKDYNDKISIATSDFDRLKKAKKTITLVDKTLIHQPDSIQKEVQELGKTVHDSIEELMLIYSLKPDAKGIQYTADKLNSIIYSAYSYFYGRDTGITGTGKLAIEKAEKAKEEAHQKISQFFQDDWTTYRQKVEALPPNLFGE